jgi:hypothetical protein
MKKKPIVRKRQPAAAPVDDDVEHEAAASASVPEAEDDLALQSAPETSYPGEQLKNMRRRKVPEAKGTALDVHDTSKLLIVAWIVLGAVVIGSVLWFMTTSSTEAEKLRNTDTSKPAQPPAAVTKVEDPETKFKANFANAEAFGNYLKFGAWAYNNATDWGGDKLVEKLKQDAQLGSVDDPEVKELIALQIENWKLMPDHPLRPYEAQGSAVGEITGAQSNSAALNSYKLNDNKIKGLVTKLRKRYSVKL